MRPRDPSSCRGEIAFYRDMVEVVSDVLQPSEYVVPCQVISMRVDWVWACGNLEEPILCELGYKISEIDRVPGAGHSKPR